jgi:hypothetical protein
MQQDVAPQVPEIDGDFFVYPDGRRLLRVRGAEGEEETAGEETPGGEGASGEPGTRTEPGQEQGEVNWEDRYKNLEGNHTRGQVDAAGLHARTEAACVVQARDRHDRGLRQAVRGPGAAGPLRGWSRKRDIENASAESR